MSIHKVDKIKSDSVSWGIIFTTAIISLLLTLIVVYSPLIKSVGTKFTPFFGNIAKPFVFILNLFGLLK